MSLRLGNNIISGLSTEKICNAHTLLDFKWSDHIINSMEWLRSDTFSWQNGDVYKAVYEHLLADLPTSKNLYAWRNINLEPEYQVFYTNTLDVQSGKDVTFYTSTGEHRDTLPGERITVTTDSSGIKHILLNGGTVIWDRDESVDILTSQKETISGITIYYYKATDGHKIVTADQETIVSTIFNDTGVAWYYIVDTTNKRFKLPRELPITDKSKGNGMTLGLTNGTENAGLSAIDAANTNTFFPNSLKYGSNVGEGINNNYTTRNLTYGITTDTSKSGIISHRANENGQQYLYFFVGNYSQSAIEQTAGITSEVLNSKQDKLTGVSGGGDYVVEWKTPTSDDPTWYRVYKSGWVEQGGLLTMVQSSTTVQTIEVRLLKPMKFYTTNFTRQSPNGDWGAEVVLLSSAEGTKFYYANYNWRATCTSVLNWEVKGMGA